MTLEMDDLRHDCGFARSENSNSVNDDRSLGRTPRLEDELKRDNR